MIAPRLRQRVDIEEFDISQDDDTGAITEAWVSIRASDEDLMAAEVWPMSGREFIAAASIQAGVNTKITIRYRSDVRPKMRVVHGTDYYNIKAVLPDPKFRSHLTLMCETGVNEG
jgi:SPP1 family predicted phage head-tail adaptor